MTDAYIRKNVKLSLEFDKYLAMHPELFKKIPDGSYIVITIKGDDAFNTDSIEVIKRAKTKKVVEAHKSDSRWTIKPFQLQTA